MLLEDATSKEEVDRALREGDEELAEDIEDKLDDARRMFEKHMYDHGEPEEIDIADIMGSDEFVEEVKAESPDEYDLSDVPDEDVKAALLYEAQPDLRLASRRRGGKFEINERPSGAFNHRVATRYFVYFSDSYLPTNYKYVPDDVAEDFWKSLGDNLDIEWDDEVSELGSNNGVMDSEDVYITISRDNWYEFANDVRGSYISNLVDSDPKKAGDILANEMTVRGHHEEFDAARPHISDEEMANFAYTYFTEDDADAVIQEITEFAKLVKDPGVPPETIRVVTRDQLVALGIKQGTLYENAPWYLVKLRPFELRLEGTQMRHCVGDKGMGYITALSEGEIEIWSLRSGSPNGKPRFTVEVSIDEDDEERNEIRQLKGKANRTPGHESANSPGADIRWPEEVVLWMRILYDLGIDPWEVGDLDAVEHLYDAFGVLRKPYRHFPLVTEWPRATEAGKLGHEWFARNPKRPMVRRSFNRPYEPA